MRIFCFLLVILLTLANSLSAQELSGDSPWENNDSPWENNASQTGTAPATRQISGSNTTSAGLRSGTTTTTYPKPKIPGNVSTSTQPAPIDGGLVALLAAGALYGGKRLRSRKKQAA